MNEEGYIVTLVVSITNYGDWTNSTLFFKDIKHEENVSIRFYGAGGQERKMVFEVRDADWDSIEEDIKKRADTFNVRIKTIDRETV